MTWQAFFYLLPYLISLGISTAVGIFACRQRGVRGAQAFAVYALSEASMTLGFIIELITPTLAGKIFWDNFQFVGTIVAPIALLVFTLQFTRRKVRSNFLWWAMALLAVAFLVLVYTDPLHGLIRPEPDLVRSEPFDVLTYEYTSVFWVTAVLIYGIVIYCIGVFVFEFIKARSLRRAQVGIILVGLLFPLVGAVLSVSGVEMGLPRDLTPFGFALGNLVIAWGVFRYRLFNLVPVARRTVLENMNDMVVVVDASHRVVDLNASAEKVLGQKASEILGQPTEVVFDRWPDLVAQFRDVEEGQAEVAYPIGGEKRHADLTISPLYDERGDLSGRILVFRDITERKRAEEALRESEKRYRHLVENTSDYILRLDQEGKVLFATDASRRFHGYTPDELVGTSGFDRIHPEDRDEAIAIFKAALETGEDARYDYRLQCKDGGYMWVETAGRQVYNPEIGNPEVVLVARDITARRAAERALQKAHDELELRVEERTAELRASEAALRRAQEVSHTGSWSLDILEDELIWSDEAYRIFGISPDVPITYSKFLERVPPEDRSIVDQAWKDAIRDEPYDIEHRILVDGEIKWVRERAEVEFDKDRKAVWAVGTVQDITTLKEGVEKLEQVNQALALLNEAGRVFSSTLDQDQVFNMILEEVYHLLDVVAIAIWLFDPEMEELVCRQAAGPASDLIRGWRLPVEGSIAGWVAQHGESQIVADAENDDRGFEKGNERTGMIIRSTIAVPLQLKENVIGVLQAAHTEPDYFSNDDLAILEPLAASAAIAIENARLFEEVHLAREQLQALSRNLVDIQEAERAAVARELHDEAGQSLSYLLLSLGMLEREAGDPDAVIARASTLGGMINALLENLHRLAVRLRPAALDHLGLTPALEQYIETFVNQYGIETQFAAIGLEEGERLSSDIETALYRVVQEALTNVARHAEASHVDVILERRDDRVVLIVEDNGVGFDVETATEQGRLGLVGMRERAQMLGGTWTIESSLGRGTTILVEVPDGYSDSDR